MVIGSYDTYFRSQRLEEWCPWGVRIEHILKEEEELTREKGGEVTPGRGSEGQKVKNFQRLVWQQHKNKDNCTHYDATKSQNLEGLIGHV